MQAVENRYIDREKSWLAFNFRVLQEAADERVPLLDRLRFLGIFSNNLDEFFRVRYAAIRRLSISGEKSDKIIGDTTPQDLIKEITETVIEQQSESLRILSVIEKELEKEGIFIINETEINKEQQNFIRDFFIQKVSPELVTIILNDLEEFPLLKDTSGYLAIKLVMKPKESASILEKIKLKKDIRYAVIEIPKTINRFVVLPSNSDKQHIILLDDVIRYNLHSIFNIFDYESISAHMIKITRDAQLELDSELHKSFIEKISSSVKDRRLGEPVRFVYDQSIDKDTLKFFLRNMGIDSKDSIIPGGRYHNRRDYMDFPNLGRYDLLYKVNTPLPVVGLGMEGSILKMIDKKDFLINTPYQSYAYIIKFLREAALDPHVTAIKITLYRLSKNSQIISSLINAAKNGKKVTVQIELQARFDEASNISYAEMMQTEGIELIFGVKGLKVHCKLCYIDRIDEHGKLKRYGFISTGNFNEATARVYTDVTLLTSHQQILKDAAKVFEFFQINYRVHRYKHLVVSPHYTRSKFIKLIDREILNANLGRQAYIKLKMNSLSDTKMIDKLYDASRAGVKIQLVVRGICSLIPGVKGMSENIEAISIVDAYLEHSRVYIFGNDGNPEVYISSADFMTRNLDARVEVTCPIYDENIKKELIQTFEIGWKGNVKARFHSEKLDNKYRMRGDNPIFRAQLETYNYYRDKIEVVTEKYNHGYAIQCCLLRMITIKKYAAIDIGSNAMRLLVMNIVEQEGKEPQFNKSALFRVPIRLGQDAFTVGEISEENISRMVDAMKAYKLLMGVYKVERYMACATSAMREAYNGKEVVDIIKKKADIKIEIIDGKKEAAIIAASDLHHFIRTDATYLYVDVGGGSTEFSLFSEGKMVASKSFKNGTVRLLNDMVNDVVWVEIEKWIKTNTADFDDVTLIGSGGNINKIFKLSGKMQDKPLSYIYLNTQYQYLNSLTYEQRIAELALNTDRADVIIHALRIYLNAMKWSGANKIYVPKIGLSDGIVKAMYNGKI